MYKYIYIVQTVTGLYMYSMQTAYTSEVWVNIKWLTRAELCEIIFNYFIAYLLVLPK